MKGGVKNMKYLVTYDLLSPGQDYDKLYDAIKSLSSDYRKMQNVWFIKSSLSAEYIRNTLKDAVDKNDKIFVCKPEDWASSNMHDIASFLNSES